VYYFEGKVLEVATRWICTFGLHSRRWKDKKRKQSEKATSEGEKAICGVT